MKKFINKLIQKLIKKSVSDVVSNPEVPVIPDVEHAGNGKKDFWKFIIQVIISILTAILTALGATSCVSHF